MKIAIASSGRFHLLDLARELEALGHEVTFYSMVPTKRGLRFGLSKKAQVSFFWPLLPFVVLRKVLPLRLHHYVDSMIFWGLNSLLILRLKPCDALIAMSGMYLEALQYAKRKYGALIFVERGSQHILSQTQIMRELKARGLADQDTPQSIVERELKGYELADQIVIPALHVERSFIDNGVPRYRLFRNAYGVDLSMFPATNSPNPSPVRLIFVGNWSYRKGVDILVNAWQTLDGVELIHVGSIGDAPLPNLPGFTHYDPVDQAKLPQYYGMAHVFVLASREEGMALVQAQALSCGLPLVCTDRSGGEDLQEYVDDPSMIKVVSSDDVEALVDAIKKMIPVAIAKQGQRNLMKDKHSLSWQRAAMRYADHLSTCITSRSKRSP
jgi:glycosyltransferase involved in cell wall biosynthesis